MPSPTVDLLRSAVSTGAYSEAERLLAVYREEMQAQWQTAASPSQRSAISSEVNELLEWARTATLAKRAHAQSKLILLSRRRAYSSAL